MKEKYFYNLNYPPYEKALCSLEMKSLFSKEQEEKYIFSSNNVEVSRSPFIKEKLSIMYIENTLRDLIDKIALEKVSFEQFKIVYLKHPKDNIQYNERLKALREIGFAMRGKAEIKNPEVILGVTQINGKWFFGSYEKNDFLWHKHDDKPHSYSNALSTRLARSLVNIAIGNDFELKLIDPCCGVGTVIIEALSMGIKVKGTEINKQIARNAKENLKFFQFPLVIDRADMRLIKESFDTAIIDLPYGVFTSTSREEQEEIIKSARRITKKLVLVTFENMDDIIVDAGFKILDRAMVSKGSFKRYINICI